MTKRENLFSGIMECIKKAQRSSLNIEDVYISEESTTDKNEFLFFIKPEITIESKTIDLNKILHLFFNKFDQFGFKIITTKVLSAKYLEDFNIIAQHYGVINRIAANAKKSLSQAAFEKFKDLYGKEVTECNIQGGIEFLKTYNDFNPNSLDFLWQNKKCEKLAGGTYIEDIKIDDTYLYLINGFHPRQLQQYIEKGRSIVVMTLCGNTNWKVAREEMIGSTFPQKAKEGSIRKELLNRKEEFGLSEVSQALNGVHLSAGPVEALIELARYNSDFTDDSKVKHYLDFSFGKKLSSVFTYEKINSILSNPNINYEEKSLSIFDLTEEKDSDEAIELLKKYF